MNPGCAWFSRIAPRAIAGLVLGILPIWGQASLAQQDTPPLLETPAFERLRRISELNKRRLADEARQRQSLDREVSAFVATNAPLYYVVSGLRDLGIQVCHEVVPAEQDWYIDSDGVPAFSADKTLSFAEKDMTVRSILDRICALDSRYMWSEDKMTGVVVLAPKENSRLHIFVGPVKEAGNPVDILRLIDQTSRTALAPLVSIGDNNLPSVELDAPRCSARELLNMMAAQQPGLTWGFAGRVQFNYVPHTSADAVRLEFPELRKGQPANSEWRYKVFEGSLDGISTIQVKKVRLAEVATAKASAPVPRPEVAAATQPRPNATEQNSSPAGWRVCGRWSRS